MDTVILRNNMRENGKSSKTCCHSQLSHMRGWRQSLSAASLLQSLLRASAPAAPCCLFNLSTQAHFKNTKRNVGQRSPSSDRDPGKSPSTWKQLISQSGVWINSLPAGKRLVFLLETFLLKNKGGTFCRGRRYRNDGEMWHTNKIKAYIPDWFGLVVTENSTCTQTCKCTELERFPLKLDFTSHKNLGCDVLLSLFSGSTHINKHYIIHFRLKKQKKNKITGYHSTA